MTETEQNEEYRKSTRIARSVSVGNMDAYKDELEILAMSKKRKGKRGKKRRRRRANKAMSVRTKMSDGQNGTKWNRKRQTQFAYPKATTAVPIPPILQCDDNFLSDSDSGDSVDGSLLGPPPPLSDADTATLMDHGAEQRSKTLHSKPSLVVRGGRTRSARQRSRTAGEPPTVQTCHSHNPFAYRHSAHSSNDNMQSLHRRRPRPNAQFTGMHSPDNSHGSSSSSMSSVGSHMDVGSAPLPNGKIRVHHRQPSFNCPRSPTIPEEEEPDSFQFVGHHSTTSLQSESMEHSSVHMTSSESEVSSDSENAHHHHPSVEVEPDLEERHGISDDPPLPSSPSMGYAVSMGSVHVLAHCEFKLNGRERGPPQPNPFATDPELDPLDTQRALDNGNEKRSRGLSMESNDSHSSSASASSSSASTDSWLVSDSEGDDESDSDDSSSSSTDSDDNGDDECTSFPRGEGANIEDKEASHSKHPMVSIPLEKRPSVQMTLEQSKSSTVLKSTAASHSEIETSSDDDHVDKSRHRRPQSTPFRSSVCCCLFHVYALYHSASF